VGLVLEIPIIIRSLAGSFAFIKERDLPLDFDNDILLTLDAGGDHKCKVVANYKLRWWTGRKPRDIKAVEILNDSTLLKCLINYRQQTTSPSNAGDSTNPSAVAGPSSLPCPCAEAGPSSLHGAGAEAGAGPLNYRQLLSDVLQDVLKFQNFASMMSTSTKNQLILGIRRAAAFNLLHEAAILKETAGSSGPAQAPAQAPISIPNRISAVTDNASAELLRLQNLPPSSYKWTWGETLTQKEVIALRRSGTKPGRGPHSGYDVSLRDGKMMGEESAGPPSMPLSEPNNMGDDPALIPPQTDLDFPKHFSNPDHRHVYNPLHVSIPSISPYLQFQPDSPLPSTEDHILQNTSFPPRPKIDTLTLAEAWLSDSEPKSPEPVLNVISRSDSTSRVPAPACVVTRWLEMTGSDDFGSDNDGPAPVNATTASEPNDLGPARSAPVLASSAINVADKWSDLSGSEKSTSPGPVPGLSSTALDVADKWLEDEKGEAPVTFLDWSQGPGPSQGKPTWSYGPEHFSFLEENMFDSSDEDPIL
jgi:hypothetical protein